MQPRIKGLVALGGLIGAGAGIPFGLVMLGQGPPSSLPSGRQIRDWASQPLGDSAVLRAAGLVCWLVWTLFILAVAIELLEQIGHRPRGAPRLRIPGLQGLARASVLTLLLVLPQRSAQAEATAPVATAAGRPVSAPARVPRPVPPAGGVRHYVVQRYDSPWSIAEHHLGDGARWRELRDRDGRPLSEPPAEPHHLASGNGGVRPRVLHPGDVVLLPSDGVHHTVPNQVRHTQPARRPIPPGPPVVAPVPPNVAPVPPVLAPAPPVAVPVPPVNRLASPPGSPPIMARADSPPALDKVALAQARTRSGSRLPTAWLEAGILSASVVGMLELLRRRQRQHRPFGRRIRLPAGDPASTELALRLGRRDDTARRVKTALGTLLDAAEHAGCPLPSILGVVVDDDGVELLLADPLAPPSPWTATTDGSRWRLANDELGTELPSRSDPLPALTPIGTVAGSRAEVLLNLEAAGMMAVVGGGPRAGGVIRAMAAALSGLPWSGAVNLVLVGFATELQAAPHVRTFTTVGDVLAELRTTAGVMHDLLAAHSCPDAFQARVRGLAGDGWPPTVVVCAEPPHDADMAELMRLAVPGGGIAAVVPSLGTPGTAWVLDPGGDGEPMTVIPLGLRVEPSVLLAPDLAALGQLLESAEDTAGVAVTEPPYDRIQVSVERPDKRVTPAVLVRLIGTVEIEGAGSFTRAKSRELAVYLAVHPHGVGEAELDEALWPSDAGRVVPASTRDSTVSVARTALGGPTRLLPAQGQGREKRYQVTGEVGSDFALFCALHRQGRATGTAEPLLAALELVRGRPFEGVASGRSYTWVHIEGHARHIESEVGDAADLAARLLLERGQPLGARWAARQGLAADPLCERLWVRLMEAADQLGESLEIERLMDELDVVLELDGDFSGLHPNTLAAYDRYRHRSDRGDRT